jgi:hypothetical protein
VYPFIGDIGAAWTKPVSTKETRNTVLINFTFFPLE